MSRTAMNARVQDLDAEVSPDSTIRISWDERDRLPVVQHSRSKSVEQVWSIVSSARTLIERSAGQASRLRNSLRKPALPYRRFCRFISNKDSLLPKLGRTEADLVARARPGCFVAHRWHSESGWRRLELTQLTCIGPIDLNDSSNKPSGDRSHVT